MEDKPVFLPTGYGAGTYKVGFWNSSVNKRNNKTRTTPHNEYLRLRYRWVWRRKEHVLNSIGKNICFNYSKIDKPIKGTLLEYNGTLITVQTSKGVKVFNRRKIINKSIRFQSYKDNIKFKNNYRWKGEKWESDHEKAYGEKCYHCYSASRAGRI